MASIFAVCANRISTVPSILRKAPDNYELINNPHAEPEDVFIAYDAYIGGVRWTTRMVINYGATTAVITPYYIDYQDTGSQRFYEITLSGGTTTEPWHKRHDPEHLKANLPYKAIVTQNGQPKAGINVTITTDVTSDSGGHVHTNSRPKGRLVAGIAASTKVEKVEIKGKTNGDGIFEFTFGAEEASGTHTLTAKCDTDCQAPATATVKAEIKGLMLLGADPLGYELRGERDIHPGNQYYSPEAIVAIINLAHGYKKKFGTVLKINDSSLIRGGLFDISGNWTPSHRTHRKGIVVDIVLIRLSQTQNGEHHFLAGFSGNSAVQPLSGPGKRHPPHF